MKKSFSLIAILAFMLTSCWSSTDDVNLTKFEWNWFTLNIPKAWIKETSLPTPSSWKIELALTSSEIKAWFANNMVILWEKVVWETTSKKYGIVNYIRNTKDMVEFTKLNEISATFPDKDEAIIYTFEAKYNNTTPKRKFLQLSKICWNYAYLTTIWINTDNDSVAKYENLLKSFTCTTKK